MVVEYKTQWCVCKQLLRKWQPGKRSLWTKFKLLRQSLFVINKEWQGLSLKRVRITPFYVTLTRGILQPLRNIVSIIRRGGLWSVANQRKEEEWKKNMHFTCKEWNQCTTICTNSKIEYAISPTTLGIRIQKFFVSHIKPNNVKKARWTMIALFLRWYCFHMSSLLIGKSKLGWM